MFRTRNEQNPDVDIRCRAGGKQLERSIRLVAHCAIPSWEIQVIKSLVKIKRSGILRLTKVKNFDATNVEREHKYLLLIVDLFGSVWHMYTATVQKRLTKRTSNI